MNGPLVFPYQSPSSLGMEDGDIVDVILNSGTGGQKRERSGSEEMEQEREKRGMFGVENQDQQEQDDPMFCMSDIRTLGHPQQ